MSVYLGEPLICKRSFTEVGGGGIMVYTFICENNRKRGQVKLLILPHQLHILQHAYHCTIMHIITYIFLHSSSKKVWQQTYQSTVHISLSWGISLCISAYVFVLVKYRNSYFFNSMSHEDECSSIKICILI